ncbi:MAG: hypothetical protein ACYTGH_21380 [Planctomycetota bacterium]|jgi:hypothetical protein
MSRRGWIQAGVIVAVGALFYTYFLQAWMQAGNFDEEAMHRFGDYKFPISTNNPTVKPGKPLYRIGKVVVVLKDRLINRSSGDRVIPATLHSSWYKLSSSVRAGTPEEVGTLIHVHIPKGSGRMYKREGGAELKYVAAKTVTLHLFDWKQKTYLGSHGFSPGDYKGDRMTDEEIKAMEDAVSGATIADYINALPVR